jgi:Zn-dependent protease
MSDFSFKTTLTGLAILGLLILGSGNIPAFLMLVAALGLHEWSHLLASELLGYHKQEFMLTAWGGRFNLDVSLAANSEAEYLIALSGPLANWLMAGGVCYLSWLGLNHPYLVFWQKVNCLLGIVNLIPAFPLDGGRILHAWLNRYLGLTKATVIAKVVTLVTAVLLLGMGAMALAKQRGGSLPLLIGCYLFYQWVIIKNPQFNATWQLLQHKKKLLSTQGILNARTVLVAPETFLKEALRAYGTHDYLLFYLMDRQQNFWLISEELAWQSLITHGFNATFLETIKAGFSVNLQKLNR